MNIAFVGKTGSGKSTLAKLIAKYFDMCIIDSNILYDYVRARKDDWETVDMMLSVSADVPAKLLAKCLSLKLESIEENQSILLENLYNLDGLRAFESQHALIDVAFYFDLPNKVAAERVKCRMRENDLKVHLKNRNESWQRNFPALKEALGERMVHIDAIKPPDEIAQVVITFIHTRLLT